MIHSSDNRTDEAVSSNPPMAAREETKVPGRLAPGAERERKAVETWENEGGHFPEPPSVAITPTDVSLRPPEQPTESEHAAMQARFEADFRGRSGGPAPILCRVQEAYRDRAARAPRENVRIIAIWANEALEADRRETGYGRVRRAAGIAPMPKRPAQEERDRLLSENPDRGFESP